MSRYGFASALDRYLTDPPDDPFSDYWEEVINAISEPFYTLREDWLDKDPIAQGWIEKAYNNGKSPAETAILVERAFNLYKPKP